MWPSPLGSYYLKISQIVYQVVYQFQPQYHHNQSSQRLQATMANRSLFQITLVVDDYDRAKAYYCGVLGFDCVEDKPQGEDKRWVVLKPGKDGAAIVLAKATTDMQKTAIGKQAGGRVGFFLATDDFSRDHKNFLEKGVKFLEQPRTMPYGTVAVFEDLYGNTWDFIEPAKGS